MRGQEARDKRQWPTSKGEMADRIRVLDWGATPLGPIDRWPEKLKGAIELMLASPQLASLAIGPERVFLYNDVAARHYGARHPDGLGQPLSELFAHEFDKVVRFYDRVFAGESIHVSAQPLDPAEAGTTEIFDAYLAPVRDRDDGVIAAFMTGFAVGDHQRTERKLIESGKRQAFLLELSDALSPLTDAAAIQQATARLVGEYLGVERAAYADVAQDGEAIVVAHGWHAPGTSPVDGTYPVADFAKFFGTPRANETATIEDALTDPTATSHGSLWGVPAARAAIAHPIFRRGRFGAALFVQSTEPRTWSKNEASLVAEVSERTWVAMARARAEAALRESEARLTLAFETLPVGIAIVDAAGEIVIANDKMRHFLPTGRIPSRDPDRLARWQGWDADGQVVRPTDFPAARALRGERVVPGMQMLYREDSGSELWTEVLSAPLRVDAGPISGAISVVIDVDRLKRSEEGAQASEERLRQFGEASQDILWIRDAETLQWVYLTPAFEPIYGLSREQALADDNYRSWQDLIVPEDREQAVASIAKVRDGKHVTFEFRIRRPSDGEVRWIRNTDFPIADATGKVVLIGGIGHDATDFKRSEKRQATLLAELQHRVRNILAVTRSIISRSDDGERSIEDYVQHLQGRIAALSRTQVLLTRAVGNHIDLDGLIRDELLAQAVSWDRINLQGDSVDLSPKVAEVLTLAIHELATNATKYGAFSRPSGRLDVRWGVDMRDGQDWLVLDWTERGVPIVDAAPRRRGFGAELISRRIPYELRGHGSLELKAGGVESHIEFPLLSGESILQSYAGDQ